MTAKRKGVDRGAELERKLSAETWTDEEGAAWTRPTAWAYAQACKVINGRQLTAEKERDDLRVKLAAAEADTRRLGEALRYHRQGLINILEFRKLDSAKWGQRDGYGGRYGALTREEIEESIAKMGAALEDGENTNAPLSLESRVADWVRIRIGPESMNRRERAMRLLEESIELAQAEGIESWRVTSQMRHVYARPVGEPAQEAAGVAVCLLGWCAATGHTFADLALAEIERIEAKPLEQIRDSLARKADADLVTCGGMDAATGTADDGIGRATVGAIKEQLAATSEQYACRNAICALTGFHTPSCRKDHARESAR